MTLVKQPFICLHVCTTYFSGIHTTIYEDIDKKIHNTFVLYTAYRIYFIREKNDSYEYIKPRQPYNINFEDKTRRYRISRNSSHLWLFLDISRIIILVYVIFVRFVGGRCDFG